MTATEGPGWRVFAIIIVSSIVVLRLVFAGLIDLLPEEAYYWCYAQHLDIGYLDHPPMVAWLIWLSTSLLGNNEFAVRLPSLLSWLVVAFFIFKLTLRYFDGPTAWRSILLIAVLPVYFSIGFMMTPDAPLYAAWAACLYFLYLALIVGEKRAWWGVGVSLGLGMLSKYSIALLGLAAFIFLISDRQSRRWFLKPQPYLAFLIALIVFSPVLFWNANNNWTSFVFQGPRRWSGQLDFSLHLLIGSALILLTPVGLAAAVQALIPGKKATPLDLQEPDYGKRQRLFMLIFTLIPILIFALNSLRSAPKLNWTGPVWLSIIPLIAANIRTDMSGEIGVWKRLLRKSWAPTILILVLFYGAGFIYLRLGAPGIPPQSGMSLPIAWKELADKVEAIEDKVEAETGTEPIIIGLDDYWISSQMKFYNSLTDDSTEIFGGRHLLGGKSLMWEFWLPGKAAIGKNIIMVNFKKKPLEYSSVVKHFARVSEVSTEAISKSNRVVGYFHWRIGWGYIE